MTTMDEQYQRGYDAARDELSVDQEYIDELHEKIDELKKQNDNIKKFLNELWDAFCVEHSDKKE